MSSYQQLQAWPTPQLWANGVAAPDNVIELESGASFIQLEDGSGLIELE